jgi:hypothetical protein
MTYSKNQQGYIDYVEMFGRPDLDIPLILSIGTRHWMDHLFVLEEEGKYFGECVRKKEKATAHGYVDFYYLTKDGTYEHGSIKEKSYDRFIARVRKNPLDEGTRIL